MVSAMEKLVENIGLPKEKIKKELFRRLLKDKVGLGVEPAGGSRERNRIDDVL